MIDRKVVPGVMLLSARHGILAGLCCLMILAVAAPAAFGGSADAPKYLPEELAVLSEELACLRFGSDAVPVDSRRKSVYGYGIIPGEDKYRSAVFYCPRWVAGGTRVEGEMIVAWIDESGSAFVLDRLRIRHHVYSLEVKHYGVDDTGWARQVGFASSRVPVSGALLRLLSDRVVAFEIASSELYFANGDGEWIVTALDW